MGWYLLVSLLHARWDAAGGIAVWLTLLLTGTHKQFTLIRLGEAPGVTQTQVHLYTALNWALLMLDAQIGVLILRARWRRTTAPAIEPADLPPLSYRAPTESMR